MIRNFIKHVTIDEYSAVPKYLQISKSIISLISSGLLTEGAPVPSINDLSYGLDVARGTIEKSYQYLKELEVIKSYRGKGYYVAKFACKHQERICLLFNNISEHKRIVYDAFVETIGNNAIIDFFIYNNDPEQFNRLIDEGLEKYTRYVVMPHFSCNEDLGLKAVKKIPKDKLILLDKRIVDITGEFGAVYENFERDIYDVFRKALPQLSKYHTIKLVFPNNSYYPKEIIVGFTNFCRHNNFRYDVINNITDIRLSPGEVYVNLIDEDLVILIGKVLDTELVVGQDIGLISYNETPIKRILLNGITTISTDFKMLGSMAAQLILENSKKQIAVPFNMQIRASI